jgi:glutathione reductase (NADPH)
MEGMAVAKNLLEGNSVKPDYTVIPSTLFTLPPLSTVGLTEETAK